MNIIRINLDEYTEEELNQLSKDLQDLGKMKEAMKVEHYINQHFKK